jgi:hypothetical protein
MPTTALAEWLRVPLDVPFRIALVLLGILSSASLIWLRPVGLTFNRSLAVAAVACVAMVVLVGREFGQREPITVILVLPYLALTARRFDGAATPSIFAMIAIGIAAGIGFAMKPYLLAVPALTELAVQFLGAKRAHLFRAENSAVAVTIAAYAFRLFLFEQPYLFFVIPLAREIYWSFNVTFTDLLMALALQLVGSFGFAILAFERRDGFGITMWCALCGFAFSYLIQSKCYSYHLMPVRTAALLLAARFSVDANISTKLRASAALLVAALTALWSVTFYYWWVDARPGGYLYRQINEINQSIERHARGGSFLVIAVRTYPSFPAGIYAPSHYISRTNGQWFLPAVAQLRVERRPSRLIEQHARDFILHDLAARPDLVLIDTDSRGHTRGPANFDFLAFYEEDPKFRTIWSSYREIEPIGKFRQFVRVADRRATYDPASPR